MASADGGRFCSDCQKVIKDFSCVPVNELQTLISANNSEELCGNFHAYQLNKPFGNWKDKLISFYQNVSIGKAANKFSLLLVMAALVLAGCHRHVRGKMRSPNHSYKKHKQHTTHAALPPLEKK